MIFYRYMSYTEFNKYLNYQTIYPTNRWNCNGICFLSEKTKVISWKDNIFYLSPKRVLSYLMIIYLIFAKIGKLYIKQRKYEQFFMPYAKIE